MEEERTMSESRMEPTIMLWKPVSSRDARSICIVTFFACFATLIVGFVITNSFGNGLENIFFGLAGFFMGVSEVTYWIHRGLRRK